MTNTTNIRRRFSSESFHTIARLAIILAVIQLTISFIIAPDSATFLGSILWDRLPRLTDSHVLSILFNVDPATMDPSAEAAVNGFIDGFSGSIFSLICMILDAIHEAIRSLIAMVIF